MKYLLLVLLLCSQAALAGWQSFQSPEGAFQVEAPDQPVATSRQNDTPMGTVTEHIYRWQQPGLEWVVNYSDVPEVATALDGAPLLAQVRQGFKRTCGGRPVTHEQVARLYGHTGRTFDFQLPAQEGRPIRNGRARVFLAESRLFVLTVTWDQPRLPDDQSAGDRFFQSFHPGSPK